MNQYERRVVEWLEKYSIELGMIVVFILGTAVRYKMRTYVSNDADVFLLQWYDTVQENGGIRSLKQQVGDYTIIYQFFIALFTYLPLEPLLNYKILSCIFDIFLAGAGGLLIWKITKRNRWKMFAAVTGLFLSPLVILNSSCWGQCDSIYTFFCILTLYLMLEEHYRLAFCMYGLAFAFKLQAIFLLPFVLLYYVRSKKFSVTKFIYIPLMVVLSGLPALLQGRKITEMLWIYGNQVQEYSGGLVYNYPNFWNLFYNIELPEYVDILSGAAIIMTVAILLGAVIWTVHHDVPMTRYNSLWLAFLFAYICVLFLPSMHDRYGYLCEILALLIAVRDKNDCIFDSDVSVFCFGIRGLFIRTGIRYKG